jgi:hypothetical protein
VEPKRKLTKFSLRQSDAFDSWVTHLEHDALLRSVGHPFKDGRWTGSDDPFQVYHEKELPALGPVFTALFGSAYLTHEMDDNFLDPTLHNRQWQPAISRDFVSETFAFAAVRRDAVEEPSYGDHVLLLNADGTEFIRKNRPGNPIASLGQFLIELRQIPLLPIFLKERAKKFSDLGSEYLNIEFGWKPFLKELIDFFQYQRKLDAALKKLRANNGVIARRRSKKKVTAETTDVCEGSLSVPFGDLSDPQIGGNVLMDGFHFLGPFGGSVTYPGWGGQADYSYSILESVTTWQCGTFYYHIPDIGSSQWTEKAKAALLGVKPTPSLLYQVIPWSWLIDWFANVGDIVSNASTHAVDDVLLSNCYAMELHEIFHHVTVSAHWDEINQSEGLSSDFFLPAGEVSIDYKRSHVGKYRQQSSPYGFGLKREDFTPRQLAILAALLVSKSKPWNGK